MADDAVTEFDYDLKEDYDLYLDPYGYVLFADGVEAEGSYVYIAEFGASGGLITTGKALAYAYFLDGTEAEITLNKIGTTKVNGSNIDGFDGSEGWYRFSKKDSSKYDLKLIDIAELDGTNPFTGTVTDYSANGAEINGTSVRGNSSTKFIVVDGDDDVSVYTGIKKVPDTLVAAGVVAAVTDGASYAKYVFNDVGAAGEVKGGSNSSDLIFLLDAGDNDYDKVGVDADGNDYYRYKAIVNGAETKIKVETDVAPLTVGTLYTSVEYNNGYVTDWEIADDTDDFANLATATYGITYKNNTVIIGSTSFYLADDAKIYVITDGDDVSTVSASKLSKDYDGTLDSYVCGAISADDGISTLYVRVD